MMPIGAKREFVSALNPPMRVAIFACFAFITALSTNLAALLTASVIIALLICTEGIYIRSLARRLLPLNVFMLLLWLTLPFSTTAGTPIDIPGFPLAIYPAGIKQALLITIKGNVVFLGLFSLIGTMTMATFTNALKSLRVPDKLIAVLVLTLRYTDVVRQEYTRLRLAMRARGFRPTTGIRTYRIYGHLIGMLFARSLSRGERILAAMKCRGFQGSFPLTEPPRPVRTPDALFALTCSALLLLFLFKGIVT